MSLISSRDLAAMRAQATASFAGTAVLERKTETPDGQGGHTTSWAPYGTVACQINPVKRTGTGENITAEQLRAESQRYGVFPALTDITPADRVLFTGAYYEVASVDEPRSMEIVRKTILTRTV